jgi:hypothetical protein
MGFSTPAFIRKNTPELRKKLEKLGYKSRTISNNDKLCLATTANNVYAKYTIITNEMFDSVDPHRTWNCAGRIDCGTNEELFLAIAALRDDTDDSQWFVYPPENIWFICDDDDINYARENIKDSVQAAWFHCSHKATVEELIEHFKGKEK